MPSLITHVVVGVSAALPVLRAREGKQTSGFTAPAGTLTAVLAIGLCAWLLSTALNQLMMTGIAAVVGLLLYFMFGRRGAAVAG